MYRHHPKTRKLREICASGEIGEPRVVRMKFHFKTAEPETDIRYDPELAGGALRDVGCYCVSMASYLAGAAPDPSRRPRGCRTPGSTSSSRRRSGFGNDLLAVFDCGMYSPLDVGVEVLGTEGRAAVSMPWYAHLEPLSIEVERDGEIDPRPDPRPQRLPARDRQRLRGGPRRGRTRDLRRGDAEKPDNHRATARGRRARTVPCGLRNQCQPPSNNPKRRRQRCPRPTPRPGPSSNAERTRRVRRGRAEGRLQDLPRRHGPRRHRDEPGDPRGRILLAPRLQRQRQDDDAAADRRASSSRPPATSSSTGSTRPACRHSAATSTPSSRTTRCSRT